MPMTRTTRRVRAFAPDPDAPGRACDMPDCDKPGEYRAPRSRENLRDWHWFCLEHVRAYNAGWDYYKGMSPGEIEAHLRADTAWQRPTWPLGRAGAVGEAVEAELAAFSGIGRPRRPEPERAPPELREALDVLGLAWPVTREAVRARYKELAKRHHPDANGGDRSAEERLKTINLAYATLRSRLPAEGQPRAAAGA
uniref:J domain-containing protein n=1 Tax=Acidocella sp. C78 TaxID=1671486 RepID=UPI00191BA735|nr:J domain-containing protein [Acidocella sp. C78]